MKRIVAMRVQKPKIKVEPQIISTAATGIARICAIESVTLGKNSLDTQ